MKRQLLKSAFLIFAIVAFSCQDQDKDVKPESADAPFTITDVTDQRIIDEINSMVEGSTYSKGDVASGIAIPPNLPAGYDYTNMKQVVISAINVVSYVAFKRSNETANFKDMIVIGYIGGVYKKHMRSKWSKTIVPPHPMGSIMITNYLWDPTATNSFR